MAFWNPRGETVELEKFNWTLHTVLMNPWMPFQHFWTTGGKPLGGSHCLHERQEQREGQNLTFIVFLIHSIAGTILCYHVCVSPSTNLWDLYSWGYYLLTEVEWLCQSLYICLLQYTKDIKIQWQRQYSNAYILMHLWTVMFIFCYRKYICIQTHTHKKNTFANFFSKSNVLMSDHIRLSLILPQNMANIELV